MSEDYIICPICGYPKKHMTKHMKMQHGLGKSEWKSMYPDLPEVYRNTHNLISKALANNWENNPEYRENCSKYWRSNLHASRKSRDMKLMWDKGVILGKKMSARIMSSEKERKIRADNMRKISKKLWTDKNYRERRRLAGQVQMLKNMQDPNYAKGRRIPYRGIVYRSYLEIDVVKFLEHHNLCFEYEKYKFEYFYEGKNHYYFPDFYLIDKKFFIEVKPSVLIDDFAKLKAKAVYDDNYPIIFVTEYSLCHPDKLLELINSINSPIIAEKL